MRVIRKKISLESFKSRYPLLNLGFFSKADNCYVDNETHFVSINTIKDKEKAKEFFPQGAYNALPSDFRVDITPYVNDIDTRYIKQVIYINKGDYTYDDIIYNSTTKLDTNSEEYKQLLRYSCVSSANQYLAITWQNIIDMYCFFKRYEKLLQSGTDCAMLITSATQYWEVLIKEETQEDYYINLDEQFHLYCDKDWVGKGIAISGNTVKLSGFAEFLCDKIFGKDILDVDYSSLESSTLSLQILIQNSIENVGEYSIFSNNYEQGVDYRSNVESNALVVEKCGSSITFSGSSLVMQDDDVYVLKQGGLSGTNFDDECKVMSFDANAWVRYMEAHKDDYELKFTTDNIYGYDYNDIIHYSNCTDKEHCAEYSKFITTALTYQTDLIKTSEYGFIYTKNDCYEILAKKYIFYKKKIYFVQVDINGEFVVIKSNRFYCDGDKVTINAIPYIYKGDTVDIQTGYFIYYRNRYILSDTYESPYVFQIDNLYYQSFKTYFIYKGKKYFVNYNGDLILYKSNPSSIYEFKKDDRLGNRIDNQSNVDENTVGYYIDNFEKVYIYTPKVVHQASTITARTRSQIEMFKEQNTACDAQGQDLNGYFKVTEDNISSVPVENTTLDLFFHINSTSRTSVIPNETDVNGLTLWGDLLKEMEFYYMNQKGEYTSDIIKASDYDGDNLKAIDEAIISWNAHNGTQEVTPVDSLYCKFTYYLGAILYKNFTDNKYELYSENKARNHIELDGIKYTDVCQLEKTPQLFYTESSSYNIYAYNIIPSTETMQLMGAEISYNIASIEYKTNYTEDENLLVTFNQTNSIIYSPTVFEEYKLGTSTSSDVIDDIYVDRPIMKPTEKNIQLLDIMSIDSLTKYGNGKIKIINT